MSIDVAGRPSATDRDRQHWPRWAMELDRALVIRPQFVISGNIRDVFLTPTADGLVLQSIVPFVYDTLSPRGIRFLLVYDLVDGLRIFPEQARDFAATLHELGFELGFGDDRKTKISLDKLAELLCRLATARSLPCAAVIDYASRLAVHPQELGEHERDFFLACEKLSHMTQPLRSSGSNRVSPFNQIFWLINRPNDLPDWFVVGNEGIRTLVAGLPDRPTRLTAASQLARSFRDHERLEKAQRDKLLDLFADLTDGLTLRSMQAITNLARDQGLPLADIADAIRCYKVGVPDNPWREEYLATRIRTGNQRIGLRVKGQAQAVQKALDILTRSATGLTGAQTSSRGGRPRGVLFFAGPTGVGKTELAKAITELIFGDEQAYKRFDMSEFAQEHSDARLIGAPPGYIGYDSGGELVNAIRQRPFSVILFDEIEKAHPRVLDKFLQILEDGRLTDGRGDTVFFSESVIIFTSNLGIYVEDEFGERKENVSPDDPPSAVEQKVKEAIEHHFRFKLQRPELLNRIGENIVVFHFVRHEIAGEIFEKMLDNVVERVRNELGIILQLPNQLRAQLLELCTADVWNGGRGIGNRLETEFINPLSRALFERRAPRGTTLAVRRIAEAHGNMTVELK